MAYCEKQVEANVREVAKKLAQQARHTDGAMVQIGETFIPMWVTFVSRAEELIAERSLFGK